MIYTGKGKLRVVSMKTQLDLMQSYPALIGHVYESVLDSKRWKSVVELVRELVGADVCHIQFRSHLESGHAPVSFLANVDPSFLKSYEDYYF